MIRLTRRQILEVAALSSLSGTFGIGRRSWAATPFSWATPAPDVPATAAGKQLKWTLGHVNNSAAELSVRDLESHFASSFLSALPADQLLAILRDYVAASGPMTIARFEGGVTESHAKALLVTPGGDWRVTLDIDPFEVGAIGGLYFEPVWTPSPPDPAVKSWKSLKRALTKVAPRSSVQIGELVNGEVQPILELEPERSLGVGSAFKLYVLAELARQIASGTHSWDELLMVNDALRSLPNGDMRLELAGTPFPLRTWAEQMISASDNTATDHLIDLLDRARVESAFVDFGNRSADRNIPLLLTREWFAIKLRLTADEIGEYLAMDVDGKRAFLAGRVDDEAATLSEVEEWPGSYFIDEIEWFASAADLNTVLVRLLDQSRMEGLEPITQCLSINPGIPFDGRAWAYVGYKGGYETGVKADSWLMQRGDGRWFVMSAIINDPDREIDGIGLWQLMAVAAGLLASED